MIAVRSRRRSILAASAVFGLCFLIGTAVILLIHMPAAAPPPSGVPGNGGIPGADPGREGDVDPPPSPGSPADQNVIHIHPGDQLVVAVDEVKPQPVELPSPPEIVTGVPAGSRRVALTFDCGWIFEPVPSLLSVLDRYDLEVTFFPRGKWLEDHPDLVGDIVAGGHEIGSHSYTHPHLTKMSSAQIDDEIRLAKEALVRVAGPEAFVPLYRPPYGEHSATVSDAVARYGYGWVVMWQVDSLDWQEPGVDAIVERVLSRVRDGGIVLMHVGTMQTVQALPRIIDELHARGYDIVQVSELLGIGRGSPVSSRTTYTVRPGDTLYAIARSFGTTVDRLLELNPWLGGSSGR